MSPDQHFKIGCGQQGSRLFQTKEVANMSNFKMNMAYICLLPNSVLYFSVFFFILMGDSIWCVGLYDLYSICSLSWSPTHDPPALDCLVLECFICTMMPILNVIFKAPGYMLIKQMPWVQLMIIQETQYEVRITGIFDSHFIMYRVILLNVPGHVPVLMLRVFTDKIKASPIY